MVTHVFDNSNLSQEIFAIDTWGAVICSLGHGRKHMLTILPIIWRPGLRLQLRGAIYRPDSVVSMLRYCADLKEIRYESTSLKRITADKSHRVIVAELGLLLNSIATNWERFQGISCDYG